MCPITSKLNSTCKHCKRVHRPQQIPNGETICCEMEENPALKTQTPTSSTSASLPSSPLRLRGGSNPHHIYPRHINHYHNETYTRPRYNHSNQIISIPMYTPGDPPRRWRRAAGELYNNSMRTSHIRVPMIGVSYPKDWVPRTTHELENPRCSDDLPQLMAPRHMYTCNKEKRDKMVLMRQFEDIERKLEEMGVKKRRSGSEDEGDGDRKGKGEEKEKKEKKEEKDLPKLRPMPAGMGQLGAKGAQIAAMLRAQQGGSQPNDPADGKKKEK